MWRLNIVKDLQSAEIKSLHATPTTEKASVGSGFHVSVKYQNGSVQRVFYRPKPIAHGASVDSVEFEIFNPGGGHAATALSAPPPSLGAVYHDVVRAATDSFKTEAKKSNSSVKLERLPRKEIDMSSKEEFPPLGG